MALSSAAQLTVAAPGGFTPSRVPAAVAEWGPRRVARAPAARKWGRAAEARAAARALADFGAGFRLRGRRGRRLAGGDGGAGLGWSAASRRDGCPVCGGLTGAGGRRALRGAAAGLLCRRRVSGARRACGRRAGCRTVLGFGPHSDRGGRVRPIHSVLWRSEGDPPELFVVDLQGVPSLVTCQSATPCWPARAARNPSMSWRPRSLRRRATAQPPCEAGRATAQPPCEAGRLPRQRLKNCRTQWA